MSVVQNVGRLLALFFDEEELGVREMGRRLGLDRSVVQRLAHELAAAEFLEQNPETRRYALGLRLLELGGLVQLRNELSSAAQPILRSLALSVGETAQLGIMDGDEVVHVARAESGRAGLWRVSPIGRRTRFHYTSIGKAILAYQADIFIQQVIDRGLERFTAHTIVDPALLRAELQAIRAQGVAFSHEEFELGLCSVGAPVRNEYGEVNAGLSILGPTSRMPREKMHILAQPVSLAAQEISRRLGWAGARNAR